MNETILNFVSGGVGGLAVDVVLFPLDTLKVRLQSMKGAKGLYRNLYKGISSSLVGSFPDAAVFFAYVFFKALTLTQIFN